MSDSSSDYLKKRKRKAKRLSCLFRLMRIFPINKKKIVFSAFEGDGGYGCNPKYIAEEIHRRDKSYRLIWLVHEPDDPRKGFPTFIKTIKDSYWNTAYQLSTAAVWVDNYRKPYGTIKRRNQLYIQTWHATIGFKAVGLYRGEAFPKIARIVSEWDSGLADYVLSNSQYCDNVYPKKLLYRGKTLRVGSPRVDTLLNDKEELYTRLRERLRLDDDVCLLLFAPTFRGGNQQGEKRVVAEVPQIDFDRLLMALSRKNGKKWNILLRLHPQLSARMDEMPIKSADSRLIDVSLWPDISEILGGCDMLLTDYSSCAFDAAFAGIPVLLYADDVREYVSNRGKFMWERGELPFDIAETNDELICNVERFEQDAYIKKVREFMTLYDVVEDGHAAERVVDEIEKYIGKDLAHEIS